MWDGACLRVVGSEDRLGLEHDQANGFFDTTQEVMLEILNQYTGLGDKGNPLQCGLWSAPVCDTCRAEGKGIDACPCHEYGHDLESKASHFEGRGV